MLPGVYCVLCYFQGKAPIGKSVDVPYLGMMSIGWNPHFENANRTIVWTDTREFE